MLAHAETSARLTGAQEVPPADPDGGAKATVIIDVDGGQLNNNGSSGSMTILASRFTIVSPGSGQRTEFSGGNWRVYDTNNVLRVQMGTW